jgi:hypothetical protein
MIPRLFLARKMYLNKISTMEKEKEKISVSLILVIACGLYFIIPAIYKIATMF